MVILGMAAGCTLGAEGDFTGGAPDGAGPGSPPDESPGEGQEPVPGQLTAADWDDNEYFDFYLEALPELRGQSDLPAFDPSDRIVITVTTPAGAPLSGVRVQVLGDDAVALDAPTASDGRLLFFPGHDGASAAESLSVRVELPDGSVKEVAPPDADTRDWRIEIDGPAAPPPALDLAFVVDTTGSMGDELEYIKAEVGDIAARIRADRPEVSMRFALILYRDTDDEYVTRRFDFVDDLADFRSDLEIQGADGGGDYPEAMDQAMADTLELSWRPGNVARVAFLIADAPPHPDKAQRVLDLADASRRKGIKIYPVAASGVSTEAEYVMRIAAQISLARYLFVTDDSGIGDPHEKPHIPCYQVQYLNDLMVHVLRSELEGAWLPVAAESVLRTVGTYENGRCVIGSPAPGVDAGAFDAGAFDAGAFDAGMPLDGGAAADAGA
ncbi:MAG TPA: vWA domain-containing protein [Haliangium sp.]|nr:vWA domain-containing protein [Haliangium sp.]